MDDLFVENVTKQVTNQIPQILFSWYDYALFSSMLIASTIIGIYFGCFGKKQSSADEYLFGERKMKVLPIAMSLIASEVSAISLLALPADVYLFGTHYWLSCIGIVWGCAITIYIYLPVLFKLQITSSYEYFKLRFDSRVRTFASLTFAINGILYLPVVIYTPALALEQATNINIHFITPIICGICIVYTTIGGLKAVVSIDMLQFSVTIVAMGAVFILGIVSTGGLVNVFKKAADRERFDLDFDWDPTKRDTFWAMIIGWPFLAIGQLATTQNTIQKFLSVPTLKNAKLTMILYVISSIVVKSVCVTIGLIIYTKYETCDPLTTGLVKKPDQLLPYFIMDVATSIPGLTGIFIAGIICAALSTLSTIMNCLAGTIYQDFVAGLLPRNITQKEISNILKLIVFFIGIVSTSLVYVVQHLEGMLPIAISFASVASGPILGVFTLGMLFPQANATGAFWSGVISQISIMCIFFGNQYYKAKGIGRTPPKILSTDTCDFDFAPQNSTIIDEPPEVFYLFKVTHYYYALIGVFLSLFLGIVISLLTKNKSKDKPVDNNLLAPFLQKYVQKSTKRIDYYSVEQAMNLMTLNDERDATLK